MAGRGRVDAGMGMVVRNSRREKGVRAGRNRAGVEGPDNASRKGRRTQTAGCQICYALLCENP